MASSEFLGSSSSHELSSFVSSPRGIPKVSSVTRNRNIFTNAELDFGHMDIWADDGNAAQLDANTRQMRFSHAASNIEALFSSPRTSKHSLLQESGSVEVKESKGDNSCNGKCNLDVERRSGVSQFSFSEIEISEKATQDTDMIAENITTAQEERTRNFKKLLNFFETETAYEPTTSSALAPKPVDRVVGITSAPFSPPNGIPKVSSFTTSATIFTDRNFELNHLDVVAAKGDDQKNGKGARSVRFVSAVKQIESVYGIVENTPRNVNPTKQDASSFCRRGEGSGVQRSACGPDIDSHRSPMNLNSAMETEPVTPSSMQAQGSTLNQKVLVDVDKINKKPDLSRKSPGIDLDFIASPVSKPRTTFQQVSKGNPDANDDLHDVSSPVSHSFGIQSYARDRLKKFRTPMRFTVRKEEGKSDQPDRASTASRAQHSASSRGVGTTGRVVKNVLPRLKLTEMLIDKGQKTRGDTQAGSKSPLYGGVEVLKERRETEFVHPLTVDLEESQNAAQPSTVEASQSSKKMKENVTGGAAAESYTKHQKELKSGRVDRESTRSSSQELKLPRVKSGKAIENGSANSIRGLGGRGEKILRKLMSPRRVTSNANGKDFVHELKSRPANAPRLFVCTESGPHLIGEPSPWAPKDVQDAVSFEGMEIRNEDSIANLGSYKLTASDGVGGRKVKTMPHASGTNNALAKLIPIRKREVERQEDGLPSEASPTAISAFPREFKVLNRANVVLGSSSPRGLNRGLVNGAVGGGDIVAEIDMLEGLEPDPARKNVSNTTARADVQQAAEAETESSWWDRQGLWKAISGLRNSSA